jgi:Nucleotide-diphospho-sugar transferase
MAAQSSSSKRKKDVISLKQVLLFILFGICCFYAGIIVGANSMTTEKVCQSFMSEVDRQAHKIGDLKKELFDRRFPDTVGHIAKGMSLVHRDDFTQRFDMGVPLDPSDPMNEDVLILYSHSAALPSDKTVSVEVESNHPMPRLDVETATENCDILNVILAAPHDPRQCFAIMGQYRSYHIQKFMRLPEKEGEKLDRKAPLRYVNRGAQPSGRVSHKHPSQKETLEYWEILKNYLNSLDTVLERLRPVADAVAQKHNNTVTVMVSNFGQSELLLNWFCAARSRGLDTSSVLLFATDEVTRDLADAIGVNVFYDNITYGNMPKTAAKRYADETFTQMMMAKVYCVQQVMMLGYNVFFQDVDVVWYKNPLDYFHHDTSPHDMYFQDDGSRGLFYAPYAANTGVYYVRNNGR